MQIIMTRNGKRIETEATMSEIKSLIRLMESEGFTRTPKYWSNFVIETRIAGGIALIQQTVCEYNQISIHLKGIR